ncbi:lamin tail domain-containing protein [bacterium]|nr:lamin tail domain-containing protein [bacterium]
MRRLRIFLYFLFILIFIGSIDALELTEIQYTSGNTFSIEISNSDIFPINLSNYSINGSTIINGTTINSGPNSFIALSSSDFTNSLESVIVLGAGTIVFGDTTGATINSISYGYQGGAPDFIAGYSLAKTQNIGNDADDWTIDPTPTMGSTNDAPIPNLIGGVVINEVNPHFGNSFIELYNNTGGSIDISGYLLFAQDILTIPLSTVLNSASYYIIEESSYPVNFNLTTIDSQMHNNVYLFDDTGIRIDQLGWESVCSFSNNSLQRDDGNKGSWAYNGYDMATSVLVCADDSKGFYNVPDCNYDTTSPDWSVSGISNIISQNEHYQIALSWDSAIDPDNPVLYDIYRSINDTLSYSVLVQDVTANTYIDTSVSVGTTYFYQIETYNCFGLTKMASDFAFGSPGKYTLQNIRQNDATGVPLLNHANLIDVEGYVNIQSGIFQPSQLSIFFQNGGYGANVFGYNPASPVDKFKVGDLIKVSGEVTFYNGVTEIKISGASDITIISSGNTVTPEIIPIAGTNWEEKEGVLVTVKADVTSIGGSSGSHWIYLKDHDPDNNPFSPSGEVELYWTDYDNVTIDASAIGVGTYLEVTGIVTQYDKTSPYNGYYEIKPRSQSDIVMPLTPPLEFENEGLVKSVIYPQSGETTNIQFNAEAGSSVIIRIYDVKGLIQKTLFDGISGSAKVPYNGTDDHGEYLNPGVYIVNIIVKSGKNVENKNFPLVIAVPLNK